MDVESDTDDEELQQTIQKWEDKLKIKNEIRSERQLWQGKESSTNCQILKGGRKKGWDDGNTFAQQCKILRLSKSGPSERAIVTFYFHLRDEN